MAVSPLPPSKRSASTVVSSKKLKKQRLESGNSSSAQVPTPQLPTSPRKRNKSPGVRVIGGRIYDDKNGKTCHQCRQKTMDFFASCKSTRNGKPCPICFCYKCLLNRYGEKAEEVSVLDSWVCPKCRGVCNCSVCMKKRGEKPTGILVHTAKAVGFSSVSELLHHKGPLVACGDSAGKEVEAVAGDSVFPGGKSDDLVGNVSKGISIDLRKKDAKMITNRSPSKPPLAIKKLKSKIDMTENGKHLIAVVAQRKIPSLTVDGIMDEETVQIKNSAKKRAKSVSGECLNGSGISRKKENLETEVKDTAEVYDVPDQSEVLAVTNEKDEAKVKYDKMKNGRKSRGRKFPSGNDLEGATSDCVGNLDMSPFSSNLGDRSTQPASNCTDLQNLLSEGNLLTTVAGINLPLDVVGGALQFLEFCAAFGKVLGLMKGQAEAVLRELSRASSRRQGLQSSVVQFHVKLLSLIDKDSGDKHFASTKDNGTTWLQALGKYIADFPALLRDLPSGIFNNGNAGYNSLDISQKLRLMNFLCDEILTTGYVRDWIENENLKFKQIQKENREELLLAKEKKRGLKQKLKDDLAQAMLSIRTGSQLTVSEHDNILSEIRRMKERLHLELKSSMKLPMHKQRSDAVRTEPFILHGEGQIVWRLKCCSNGASILLQDIDSLDSHSSKDQWFSYTEEHQKTIEKHILKERKLRLKRKNLEKRALLSKGVDMHLNNGIKILG